MDHNWVNKAREKKTENEISTELGSLSDRPTCDACYGYCKSPLVKIETVIVSAIRNASESKQISTDERVRTGAVAEGKCEAEEVEGDASNDGVDDIGEHNVDGVLSSDRAGTEHGEADLHDEDEVGRKEEEDGVEGVCNTLLP